MSKSTAKKSPKTKKRGPKPYRVDWYTFDKLAAMNNSQVEIANFFDISVDTLERAAERDRGMKLADLWDKKRALQKTRLRKIQWSLAEQGSTGMAIFLGKHYLGQRDDPSELDHALLNSGLTKQQAIELIMSAGAQAAAQSKRSFEEFCTVAGYPEPYETQVQMKDFGMHETEPRLILGSRGYGKTEYVVILGIAYDLYINPGTSTNLIITKSKDRNTAMIREIQLACEKNGVVFEIANQTNLRVAGLHGKDNSVAMVTIKTASLRGRHPKRIILDDPVTEDDTSEATRKLVKKKWNEVNKLASNILVIGQPAHKFDLYAELRGMIKKMEVPHGTIPDLDADLLAQKSAGVDDASIEASYHLRILNEGTTPFDNIQYIDKFPIGESAVAWIDPSHEGGDYTALTILRMNFDCIAVVGFVYKKAWNHCLDEMVIPLQKYNVRKIAFEMNALGDQPVIMLRQLFKETGVGIVGKKSVDNKHSKIMAAGAFAHRIQLSRESHPKYIEQVVQYEYGAKVDDAPDSLASCMGWLKLIRGKK